MRTLLAAFTFLVCLTSCWAQMHNGKFGNEWIIHNQNYYKIKIANDGFYKIDKQLLQQKIGNLNQIAPNQFQIFCMGKQIPIYVHAPNGTVEYISFYAEKNNGALDVNLYRNAEHHFNPDYSLITDNAAYFLTWSTQTNSIQYQTQTANLNNLPSKEPYFFYTAKEVFNSIWNPGAYYTIVGTQLYKGSYDYGEGFGSKLANNHSVDINTPHLNASSTPASLDIRGYALSNLYVHQLQVNVGNQTSAFNSFSKDSVYNVQLALPSNQLQAGDNTVSVSGIASVNDLHTLSSVAITYPRNFNFDGKASFKFEIKASNQKKYLEIDNFDGGQNNNQEIYLYDLTNNLRINCFWDGTTVRVVLPSSAQDRTLILQNETQNQTISTLTETVFENYTVARGNYIVITHPSLRSDSQGNDPIFDYCAYRSTTGQVPTIHSIEELYNQFAYGIEGHPIAIKNFAAYINANWQTAQPKHVFLIGKGQIYTNTRHVTPTNHLIPTFGTPPSDNLLLSHVSSDIPMIPVGRLAVSTGDEVRTYLNKIKQHELNAINSVDYENQHWRKNIVHLGGGKNNSEQGLFKYYLTDIEKNTTTGKAGSKVYSFFKNNTDYATISNSVMIDSLINNGVSMVTFFGHGSTTDFDYYLNTADYYKNKDKYPLIFAMGCYNGTIYEASQLMSERFVLKEDAGASAYLSFGNAVAAHAAHNLGDNFYKHSQNDLYGAGIGQIIQKSIADIANNPVSYDFLSQLANNYFILHGDPVLKLNYKTTPDYHIHAASVETSPKQIKNHHKNFKLKFDINNWGTYQDTTLTVKVIRTHPLGTTDTTVVEIPAPKNHTAVELLFPINGYEDLGLNKFSIFVDADNRVNELPQLLAEENNILINHEIAVGNVVVTPVAPREFEIVNTTTLKIKAAAANAFETNLSWWVELDTNNQFNSSELVQLNGQSTSNIIECTPNIVLKNNQVYYWRVRVQNSQQAWSDWTESSFIYLSQATSGGWNQSHIYQYEQNDLKQLYINGSTEAPLSFTPSLYEVGVKNQLVSNNAEANQLALYQNGSKADKCRCPNQGGVYVAVLDPATLEFWDLPGHTSRFGAINCDGQGRTAYSFLFNTQNFAAQQDLERFIVDSIPNGHLVVLYTLNNAFASGFQPNLVQLLKNHGATKVDDLMQSSTVRPYAVSFVKGTPNGPAFSETLGQSSSSKINLITSMDQAWYTGKMTSKLIGPMHTWNNLEWATNNLETPLTDSVDLEIWGVTATGEKTLLHQNVKTRQFDLTSVDATQYPYLQLAFNSTDETNQTAAQLEYWRVWGQSGNDVALSINNNYPITYDSLEQSDLMTIDLTVQNLSTKTVSNLVVQLVTLGQDTIYHTIPSIGAQSSKSIQVNIPISDLEGQQVLVAYVQALNNEPNLNNNWGWLDFFVQGTDVSVVEIEKATFQNISNFPNPFTIETQIVFDLEGELPQEIQIDIYNTQGQLIKSHIQEANLHNTWIWNGQHNNGTDLPAGIYYGRISSRTAQGKVVQSILKMIKA